MHVLQNLGLFLLCPRAWAREDVLGLAVIRIKVRSLMVSRKGGGTCEHQILLVKAECEYVAQCGQPWAQIARHAFILLTCDRSFIPIFILALHLASRSPR